MAYYPDGEYTFDQLKDSFGKEFKSERELCDFLENHIRDFCSDFLEVEYKSHVREKKLFNIQRNRVKGNRRIDFYIETVCGKVIIIECKHPITLCELSPAVGQCLSYACLLANKGVKTDRVILLSTKIDQVVTQVITDYSLPIEYMVMDRNKCVKFTKYGKA